MCDCKGLDDGRLQRDVGSRPESDLVSPPRWMRRLLLLSGWSATAIVAMIGPAAFWSFVSTLVSGATCRAEGESPHPRRQRRLAPATQSSRGE
jgi:hypothetical protein